jgi:hypothetical protein
MLDLANEALNKMALSIKPFIIATLLLAIGTGWDNRHSAAVDDCL